MPKLINECYGCGGLFEGRPNAMYCCRKCKDRVKYLRRRVRQIEVRMEHSARQKEIAEIRGDWLTASLHSHRERHLRSELDMIIKTGVTTEEQRGEPNALQSRA